MSLWHQFEEGKIEEDLARLWEGFALTDQERLELVLQSSTLNKEITKERFFLAPCFDHCR